MRPLTLMRLALAGSRTDTLRVALTGMSAALATLAILSAATVLAIPGSGTDPDGSAILADQYRSKLLAEPGLRPGVAFGLVLLTIPVLALAAQCGRLGAPARDRRLAAIRLAGATPRQVVALVTAETGVASTLGVAAGLIIYLTGRAVLDRPDAAGRLALPADVLPPTGALVAITIGLPLVATAVAAVLLRRVTVTPFGVARKVRRKAPKPWPGLLIVLGMAAVAVLEPLGRYADRHELDLPHWVPPALLFIGGLLAMTGVVLGTGWISFTAGRLLHKTARRPAALLAAARLMADPWSGSRTFTAMLAAVMFGAGAAEVRASFAATFAAEAKNSTTRDTAFYFQSLDLVDAAVLVATAIAAAGLLVALAEGIVSRRRTYTAQVATGVPRAALARSILWQVFTPIVPAVLIALTVGDSLLRSISPAGQEGSSTCDASGCKTTIIGSIPIPLGDLAFIGATTLAAVIVVVGLGLVFLKSSTTVEELRAT
jgi:hypothetical protein